MQNEFGVKEEIATENISSTVSSEMRMDAVIAVIICLLYTSASCHGVNVGIPPLQYWVSNQQP